MTENVQSRKGRIRQINSEWFSHFRLADKCNPQLFSHMNIV